MTETENEKQKRNSHPSSGQVQPEHGKVQHEQKSEARGSVKEKQTSTFENLKNELALLSLLVLFVGLLSTESYYASFGMRYQALELPAFHIVYRGLTAVVGAPYLAIAYLLSLVWIGLEKTIRLRGRSEAFRAVASYGLILLLLIITFPMARHAGVVQANRDLQEDSSSLPKIVRLEVKDGPTFDIDRRYRLLAVDKTYIVYFRPISTADGEDLRSSQPHLKRLLKGDVHVLETVP